jgi:glycosyltransferase involved in cell wall biosynthesis
MYKDLKVSLVIPAYNEERLIKDTLESVPDSVDKIFVVDDGSIDKTAEIVENFENARVELIRHGENKGVGAAIITGYLRTAAENFDVAVVIGGDNQMPLEDLPNFLDPFVNDEADYVKGNRFLHSKLEDMPFTRLFGNSFLSLMTKIASGYWKIFDTQDGYTAISRKAIELVDWDKAWKGYGYVSDFLIRLNVYNLRVKDVPRRAIYLPNERQSQINIVKYIFKVTPLIFKGFLWRLKEKYILRDFHPLVFFYSLGLILLPIGILLGFYLLWIELTLNAVTGPISILCALFVITGLQSILFAMLFDMEYSEHH